jgi:hypothetical protein
VRFQPSLIALVAAAWACIAHAQQVRILIQSSPLAGYQYHAGAEVWERLQAGDPLTLVREPDNPHDRNAVRVEWQGRQLGYLPRAENAAIAVELDRGARVEARIARLREAKNPWQRVLIEVFIRI